MLIGQFKYNEDAKLPTGWIRTRTLNMDYVEMHRIPDDKRTERGPLYELYEPNIAGNLAPVGALWSKPMQDGNPFLSGFIDDEVAKEEKQVAFFGSEEVGFDVQYRRGPSGGQMTAQGNGGNGPGRARGQQRGGNGYGNGNGSYGGRRSGFSGGSTAGPNGEYVGNGRALDDEVPF